jgi:serine/threonine protein kinase
MKAVSRKDGKWYAVKIIQESRHVRSAGEQPQQPVATSRSTAFAREIAIMETLDHPNICKLKEVFYQDNNDISMEASLHFTNIMLTLSQILCWNSWKAVIFWTTFFVIMDSVCLTFVSYTNFL